MGYPFYKCPDTHFSWDISNWMLSILSICCTVLLILSSKSNRVLRAWVFSIVKEHVGRMAAKIYEMWWGVWVFFLHRLWSRSICAQQTVKMRWNWGVNPFVHATKFQEPWKWYRMKASYGMATEWYRYVVPMCVCRNMQLNRNSDKILTTTTQHHHRRCYRYSNNNCKESNGNCRTQKQQP